jgi:hypothetical protein
MRDEIDLGDGHRVVFSEYKGEKRVAANIIHPTVDGKCDGQGFISFTGRAWAREFDGRIETWEVVSEEPFTISPSVLCRACGDHGFVRDGRWVRA